MLPSTPPSKILLACTPFSSLELACLSSPCHRSDLPSLSFAMVQISLTLTLSRPTVWCYGETALFVFLLSKAALAYLITALFVSLRPLSPFQQAQYVQVSLLKPMSFFKLFAGLGSISKHATTLFFSYLTSATLFCPLLHLSFCLDLSGRFDRNRPHSLLLLYQATGHCFSRGTTRLISWPDGSANRALCDPLQFLSPYLLCPLFSFPGLEAYCPIEIL